MNVLVLGSGGRENAIAWKISQSKRLNNLFCMPGNPGTDIFAKNISGDIKDFDHIKNIALDNKIDLVIVGPEDPLVSGLKNYFASDNELKDIRFIGPDSRGAALEGSKDFAKEFMTKYYIPTAHFRSFTKNELNEAQRFLESLKPPYVIKADGLAGGKGVIIVETIPEAMTGLKEMFDGKFGNSGQKVVIEEYLNGIELSVFILTDGKDFLVLPEAKDYKRIGDGDRGLNTGGMGAVSPVVFADDNFMNKVIEKVAKPTIEGLIKENIDYKGFIFIGLMNCNGEPYVIEYNVRMGDPETEAVMTRIESDLLEHLIAAADGNISGEKIFFSEKTAVTLITVSGGYPENYTTGYEISGLTEIDDAMVFHSGTSVIDGKLTTKGGRVLAVTALADNLQNAMEKAYTETGKISYKDIYYRTDIGSDLINYGKK